MMTAAAAGRCNRERRNDTACKPARRRVHALAIGKTNHQTVSVVLGKSQLHAEPCFHARLCRAVNALNVFDKELLHQPIGFMNERVMVPFANFANLMQARNANGFSHFAEGLERVLRLPLACR